jgi:hypothetical protein
MHNNAHTVTKIFFMLVSPYFFLAVIASSNFFITAGMSMLCGQTWAQDPQAIPMRERESPENGLYSMGSSFITG